MNESIDEVARAWVDMAEADPKSEAHENAFWAFLELDRLIDRDPPRSFEVILKIVELNRSEKVLALLGASAIENAMCRHGLVMLLLIEKAVPNNDALRKALQNVHLDPEDTPVWKRFYEVAECDPGIGEESA